MSDRQSSSIFLKLFVLVAGIGTIAVLSLGIALFQGGQGLEEKDILIPRGASVASVAGALSQAEIIRYPLAFKIIMRFTGGQTKLRAGEYRFRSGMSLANAMQVLYSGEGIKHRVTFPEGWTAKQIAAELAEEGLVNAERFAKLALSGDSAKKYKLTAPNLEGFLYPDTYDFSKVDGEEKILDIMVQQFFKEFTPEMREHAKSMGFTLEEVVTLASIIERETGNASERELVSSVFHNRLKKRMRLQSDPTTIYGIADFNGNLTKKDLLTPTPYNTYTIPALPPGAIANPGLPSLKAALAPADSKYLYFVAKKPGEGHIFSETYSKHSRNVNDFQKAPSSSLSKRAPNSSLRTPASSKKKSKRAKR